jgi:Na+-translocating ferredoxin:NAD+ oxidoreductase RNF subunit RnfB
MITELCLGCTEVVQSRQRRAMSVSGHEEGWSMITELCLGCTEVVQSRQRRAMSVSGHEEGWSMITLLFRLYRGGTVPSKETYECEWT